MTKKELKDFRARLVKARDWECRYLWSEFNSNVISALEEYELPVSDEVGRFVFSTRPHNRRKSVAALFANSIAALDKQIAEGK